MKKFCVLTLIAAVTTTLMAAESDRTSWQNLNHLSPGQPIQVSKSHGEVIKGTFVNFDGEFVNLLDGGHEIVIPRGEVSRIDRHSGKRKKVMWIGLAVGSGAGAGIGAGAGAALSNESGGDFSNLTTAITAAFAGVGALAGLAIGSVIDSRQNIIYKP